MWRAIAVASLVLTACAPTQQLQAEIQEVATSPVFASQPNQAEQPASEGTVVIQGGQIRTESPGKAQIQLSDGLQFRLGGNALLKIEPELQLDRGQIIAWLTPNQKRDRPLQIRTPTATAAIRGTTVFIEQTETQTLILSWEGQVEVQLPSGVTTQLTSGQLVRLRPGQTTLPTPERLSRPAAEQRFQRSLLLNGFATPMETLPEIRRQLLGLS
ncbi:FecR family protein [Synechococcus elongatus]|uniref:FecR protein domain-containing protein n=1 Tax=Synechococcus elongatus (strain ATCC 33912 / PCC 7942 / FACHB-805) TaxID=1140 RepID=Q31L43_SYNE7|nr:FecR family protein [Synechococcus elongatus]ABB58226.1 conserved hypothetical protein [Synechococcus elongatus PCC 7942 = FACHB-805]AJD57301.1 hypothetical protein M744_05365 [Synechococcus elongatus UTEX 2973]MBD2586949.1 FecR domain-containing protein [Synechococcus elongatus FACHB-242]MBD2688020.1 FecR domain-containing protein [Synechococcus elongatus FACHB-1061]MBD2706269.1 FecR domain-containing protein [Synechococcus elongatus PCC 7942 = FACHB-805]